jgi:hypothetical protein
VPQVLLRLPDLIVPIILFSTADNTIFYKQVPVKYYFLQVTVKYYFLQVPGASSHGLQRLGIV